MAQTNRISHIDVFRGLLMLLVVLGHSIGNTNDPVNKTILSFHMPAFYILSGMCFHQKQATTMEVLKKKARGLIWPYISLSAIGVLLYWLLLAGTNKDLGVNVAQSIIGIVWNDGQFGRIVTGGFWFVYDLIWITFIHILTRQVDSKIRFLVTTISLVSLYLLKAEFYLSTELLRISAGYLFFQVGVAFTRICNSLKMFKFEYGGGKQYLLCSTILMAVTIGISRSNDAILMYDNRYGKLPMFILTSLVGTTSIYLLAKAIQSNKFIEFVGRNTLPILQMHFFVLMTTHVALHKVLPEIENYSFPFYLLHFAIAVLSCCCYSWMISKYFPWLLRWKT